MPAKKIRVELFDADGNKYSIMFEGQITRDKAVRLLDLVELLGGTTGNDKNSTLNINGAYDKPSKYDRVQMVVQRSFPIVWFSSRDLQLAYEQEFKEPISLSTAATYLSRLATRGKIARTGASNNLRYRLATSVPPVQLEQSM